MMKKVALLMLVQSITILHGFNEWEWPEALPRGNGKVRCAPSRRDGAEARPSKVVSILLGLLCGHDSSFAYSPDK